jgi:hypothetical protein
MTKNSDFLFGQYHSYSKENSLRPYFKSGLGGLELCRNRVGTECEIESRIAHPTSILEAGMNFSSRIRLPSLFFYVKHLVNSSRGINAKE